MAQNGITYVGRLINNRDQCEFGESKNGNPVLKLVLAEQHTERNDRAPQKYQDRTKASDDYVPTTTSWHRVTIFGDEAKALAADPDINHGALIQVTNAQYREEDDWETKDGVRRAGRPETIGRDSKIGLFVSPSGKTFPSRDEFAYAIWDGGPIPRIKGGSGSGGGGTGREYSESEGF